MTDDAVNAVSAHPQILVGLVVGVVLTVVIHAIRRIRRLITTGIVLAIAGGSTAGVLTGDALPNLLHYASNTLHNLLG